jgi:hypothetical protein
MGDETELDRLLLPTATNSERLAGLLALGLGCQVIAATTRSSTSTLRNWKTGQTEPRSDATIILDDLRMIAKTLIDGGLEPERAARWLTSRDPDRFDGARPIEIVPIDPMEVLAAAHAITLAHQSELVAV